MKRKIWLGALAASLATFFALLLASFFFDGKGVEYREAEPALSGDVCIEGAAGPTSLGYFVGDRLEFRVEVLFCNDIEVNEKRMVRAINLAPFEQVGDVKISRKNFSNGLKKIEATYTILGIEVFPGKVYTFPAIPVEYSRKGSKEQEVYRLEQVKPIYISRLSPTELLAKDGGKASDLVAVEFRPLKREFVSGGTFIPRNALIGLAVFLLVLAVAELAWIKKIIRRPLPPQHPLSYAEEVRAIREGILLESKDNPRAALHRLYCLTREVVGERDFSRSIAKLVYRKEDVTYDMAKALIEEFSKAIETVLPLPNKGGGER